MNPLRPDRNTHPNDTPRTGIDAHYYFQAKVLDLAGQAVIATDLQGKVIYWSRAAQRLYGWSEKEVMGRPIPEIMPSEDRVNPAEEVTSELMAGRDWSGESEVRRKDGTTFSALITYAPMYDEQGTLAAIISASTDITNLKKTEELRRSEERFRSLVQNASDVISVLDADGTVSYVSPAIERMLGYQPEERVGKSSLELLHPDDLARARSWLAEGLSNPGVNLRLELRMQHRDNSWRHVEVTGTNLLDDVAVGGIVLNWRDVTERKQAEERLRQAEIRYRTLVERMPAVVYIQEIGGPDSAMYMSPQIEALTGYSPEECKDPDLRWLMVHADDREQMQAEDERVVEPGEIYTTEYRVIHRDGRIVWVRNESVVVKEEASESCYWQGFMLDITERKRADEALRESETCLAEAQRIAHLGSWEWNLKTGEVWWSDEAYRIYGFEPQQFSPTLEMMAQVFHPDDRHLLRAAIEDATHKGESHDFEHRIVRPDGEVRWIHRRGEVVRREGGRRGPLRMVGTTHDITERKALETRLKHQAFHDLLTDLPNRWLFVDRLKHALKRISKRRGREVAVLLIDLDNFKVVNDSLGHEMGDKLLVAVAQRLRSCLRLEDTLTRLGGDEFTILIEDVEGPSEAIRVAERIVECVQHPFILGRGTFVVTASIGIALGEADTKPPEELLKEADTAMYQAKEEGTLKYKVFETSMYERVLRRLQLENDLRRALKNEELKIYYQPITNLLSRELWGVEVLLRWEHPQRGLLSPEQFVPLAEESGLIVPIGGWVLEEACRQAKEWQEKCPRIPPFVMCVNFSARQLQHPSCIQTLEEILQRTGLEAGSLCLDITETAYIQATAAQQSNLEELKGLGVRISIDDFGTGYSSLSYLKRLPANDLKLDKSFVGGIGKNVKDTAIVRTIIDLAHTLGMEVIAEGVESIDQVEKLIEMGCELGQGYHFSEPLPPQAVCEFLVL